MKRLAYLLAGLLSGIVVPLLAQDIGGAGVSNPPVGVHDASLLTGEIDDDRLSSNVPLLDAANTFTSTVPILASSATEVQIRTMAGNADLDEGRWDLRNSVGTFAIRAVSDDGVTSNNALLVSRDGSDVRTIALTSTNLTWNGDDVLTDASSLAWSKVTGAPTTLSGYGITDAQALDSDLTAIAALTPADDSLIVGNGTAWSASSSLDSLSTDALTVNSVDITPSSGSITATFDNACTTSPTVTFNYWKMGQLVTLVVDPNALVNCTSDSTSFATTGAPIPAALRPDEEVHPTGILRVTNDDNANGYGCLEITAAGNIKIARDNGSSMGAGICASTSWTASGAKKIFFNAGSTVFQYLTDVP